MKRFIIKYSNGQMMQQEGINGTFHHLLGLQVVSWIIDTKDGTIMAGTEDQAVVTKSIPSYTSTDLIVPKP